MVLVTVVMAIVSAIALPTQYFINKSSIELKTQQTIQAMESELAVILQEPVYVYDKSLIHNIIDAYAQKSLISSIKVNDQNGKALAQVNLREIESRANIKITWDNLPVGEVEIGYNEPRNDTN